MLEEILKCYALNNNLRLIWFSHIKVKLTTNSEKHFDVFSHTEKSIIYHLSMNMQIRFISKV